VIPAVALMVFALALLWAVAAQIAKGRAATALPPPLPVPVRRPVRTDVPHALYYYLWAPWSGRTGRCYWGISNEPEARHARHGVDPDDQWWYRQSTGIMYYDHWEPNRDDARAAERQAIRADAFAGAYLANDHHNPLKVRQPRAIH
jgi:hypothetical protein